MKRHKHGSKTKKSGRVSRLERTAFHEAGHAVVAHVLGRGIVRITINAGEDFYGQVLNTRFSDSFRPDVETSGHTRSFIEREVKICFAGNAAESARLGREVRGGAHHDFASAVDLLSHLTGSNEEIEAYANWLWVCTKNKIKTPLNWSLITALAQELLKKREMSGREAKRFLNETQERIFDQEKASTLRRIGSLTGVVRSVPSGFTHPGAAVDLHDVPRRRK